MTNEDRERDTLPPGSPSTEPPPTDPPLLTEGRFREILAEVVGTRFVELHERVRGVEMRVGDVEKAVARAVAVRDVLPMVISILAMASSVVALAVR